MNRILRVRVVIITVAFLIQVIWWLTYFFVLAPRVETDFWWARLVAIFASIMLCLPFVQVLKGIDPLKKTQKQWLAWVAAPYCAVLAMIAFLPFSNVLAGVAFLTTLLGIHLYVYYKVH